MTDPTAVHPSVSKIRNTDLPRNYHGTRKYTEDIFAPLAVEDYLAQPEEFVSPPKWNLGHTTWFFETFILQEYRSGYKPFSPEFAYIFNSYYNAAGSRVLRHKRGDLTRPTVEDVYTYRRHVDREMSELMSKDLPPKAWELIQLGIQHEQQHQELFWTDLKYTFHLNPGNVCYDAKLPWKEQEETFDVNFIPVKEGLVRIGHQGNGFCYDNELQPHKVFLHDFQIADRLVTNAEFIEFIEDGGYENFVWWHDEGWKWVNEQDIQAPLYWEKRMDKWFQYTLKGFQPVVPDEALKHISFYEAFAFAEWKGCRLPTEFEWEAAADLFNWGSRWEWTNSAYLPYPGYQKESGAVGEYNGKFMVNQMVLRGASVATTPGHSRKSYRNFFHPWERWQFTGIRLAR